MGVRVVMWCRWGSDTARITAISEGFLVYHHTGHPHVSALLPRVSDLLSTMDNSIKAYATSAEAEARGWEVAGPGSPQVSLHCEVQGRWDSRPRDFETVSGLS